jgi:hypothetical protein
VFVAVEVFSEPGRSPLASILSVVPHGLCTLAETEAFRE